MTTDAGSLQHRYIETALCWDLLKYIYIYLKYVETCFWMFLDQGIVSFQSTDHWLLAGVSPHVFSCLVLTLVC